MRTFIELKRMALRNLARHKMKTILTCLAVTVSVCVYIFMDSWIGGMLVESRRNIVNYEIGAAKLQSKLYFEKKDDYPSYETFAGWEAYKNALDQAGYYAAPRYVFSGTLYALSGSAPLLFNAVDPNAETEVLRYASWIESGRYVRNGEFALVLGTMAAEKLKVGIPQRPTRRELEALTAGEAQEDRNFILGLYENAPVAKGFYTVAEKLPEGDERLRLKKDIPQKDLDRYWNMLAASGRNDVRISTVIDIKAAPETIRREKWEEELFPALSSGDQNVLLSAYQYDDLLEAYTRIEEDKTRLEEVLNAMIRADFSGAVAHISQTIDATVVGVINSPDPMNNANIAYMPLDVLQDEAGMMLEGRITELLIRAKNAKEAELPGLQERAQAITDALSRQGQSLPETLGVYFWLDYVRDYLGYEAMESASAKIFPALLFLLAFLGISNTILMSILERTKEIGMMRAMGMTDGQMVLVYMLEAGGIGLIGSLLGIALGCAINYPMVKYGMDFSQMVEAMGGSMGYRISSNFRSVWNIPVIIGAGIAATALSALMAFFPTKRAVKMPITDSLRFE
jgi:ABC-type lipoprotein release transport system permease subunit